MALKEMLEIVSQCPMFNGFTVQEQYSILRDFQPRQFEAGYTFIHEGQLVDELCMTAFGKWEIFLPKNLSNDIYRPEEVHLQKVSSSAMLFGEFSFFDRQPASASVRALEDCKIYTVNYQDFMDILNANDHIGKIVYRNMLNVLIGKIRKDNEVKDWLSLTTE